jgi:hypothetical protein
VLAAGNHERRESLLHSTGDSMSQRQKSPMNNDSASRALTPYLLAVLSFSAALHSR